jgi:hypothetical protein
MSARVRRDSEDVKTSIIVRAFRTELIKKVTSFYRGKLPP